MVKNKIITVQDIPVTVSFDNKDDFICITDMAAAKGGNSRAADVVKNWIRNRITIEFLGTWEQIYNADFKVVEFDHFKSQAGLHTFVLSVSEWINATNAIGLYVKKGRYGGTYAHKDIAFEFASAISPVFKLYLIKEFQRLKEEENNLLKLEWDAKRFLLNLESYDAIVFGGWAVAGSISKLKWFKSNISRWHDKKLIAFCVGASPIENPEIELTLPKNFSEEELKAVRWFYCPGGLDYEKMPIASKTMMKMFIKALKARKNKTDDDMEQIRMMSSSYDISDVKYIEPIIDYLNGTE